MIVILSCYMQITSFYFPFSLCDMTVSSCMIVFLPCNMPICSLLHVVVCFARWKYRPSVIIIGMPFCKVLTHYGTVHQGIMHAELKDVANHNGICHQAKCNLPSGKMQFGRSFGRSFVKMHLVTFSSLCTPLVALESARRKVVVVPSDSAFALTQCYSLAPS